MECIMARFPNAEPDISGDAIEQGMLHAVR
jgi:hypothetical protein